MAVGDVAVPNTIYPIQGIRIGVAKAGVRYADRDDVTVFEVSGDVALVSTQNQFVAAPVQVAKLHLKSVCPRFLLVNTGNANAATGQDGIDRAVQTCQALAEKAKNRTLTEQALPQQVLPFSTGVIGECLPSDKIINGLDEALDDLSESNWLRAASAIMTTDTTTKFSSVFGLGTSGICSSITLEGFSITPAPSSFLLHPTNIVPATTINIVAPLKNPPTL